MVFRLIASFILWGLIFGMFVLCTLPFSYLIKNEGIRKVIFIFAIIIWFVATMYLATVNPFF